MSHVLLPVLALVRRADVVEVIGAALEAKATGAGVRTIAWRLGLPAETVRGWVRRLTSRAEAVRAVFLTMLVAAGVDPVPPAVTASVFADAVAAVRGLWVSLVSRWPHIGEVSPWRAAAAVSGGRLLAPAWPPESINTNCP